MSVKIQRCYLNTRSFDKAPDGVQVGGVGRDNGNDEQPPTSNQQPRGRSLSKKNQHQIKLLNYIRSQRKKVNFCFYDANIFCLCFRRQQKLKTSVCNKSFVFDFSGLSSTYLQNLLHGFALKSNHHKNEEVIEWKNVDNKLCQCQARTRGNPNKDILS